MGKSTEGGEDGGHVQQTVLSLGGSSLDKKPKWCAGTVYLWRDVFHIWLNF